ncbi:hypothetical protein [Bosea caraganae]|nr:hypothetical protein [Bosea caraganae]
MKTAITIDELRRMAARHAVSLPRAHASNDDHEFQPDAAPSALPLIDGERAARISELIQTSRELAKRRTPEETAELERRLEEREG